MRMKIAPKDNHISALAENVMIGMHNCDCDLMALQTSKVSAGVNDLILGFCASELYAYDFV